MQLTQQIKIQPTSEQKDVLLSLSERCRLIYNFALTERTSNGIVWIHIEDIREKNIAENLTKTLTNKSKNKGMQDE